MQRTQSALELSIGIINEDYDKVADETFTPEDKREVFVFVTSRVYGGDWFTVEGHVTGIDPLQTQNPDSIFVEITTYNRLKTLAS